MAEGSPLARSSIASARPLTVVDGWEVSSARSEAPLRITDCTPMAKVCVRANPEGSLARALHVPFGRAQRDQQGSLVIGSGPGEWLVLDATGTAPALVDRIRRLAGGEFASAIDLTHGRAVIRLTGSDAARLLAKLCAIDFVADKVTKKPFDPDLKIHKKIQETAMDHGLLCYGMGGTVDGKSGDHVLIAPPYTINSEHQQELVEKFTAAVTAALPH